MPKPSATTAKPSTTKPVKRTAATTAVPSATSAAPTCLPAFSLPGSDGAIHSAAELRGRTCVLYVYPKDHTPGCTQEACDFRDAHARLHAAGVIVIGLSCDSVERHRSFVAKYRLPFLLLSDVDHRLAEALGVWQEKSLYGRRFMGLVRTTLLINATGHIVRTWPKVRVGGHAEAVVVAALELARGEGAQPAKGDDVQ